MQGFGLKVLRVPLIPRFPISCRAHVHADVLTPPLPPLWRCGCATAGSCRPCVGQRWWAKPCASRPGRLLLAGCQRKGSLRPCKQVHASFPLNHRVPFLIGEVASGRSVTWPSAPPRCQSGDTECCDPQQRDEGCGETPACCGCRRLPAARALPRSAVSSPKNPV